MTAPEQYFVDSTPWVPGSRLPVLVYRGPLSHCQNEDEVKEALEANGGWAKGVCDHQTSGDKHTQITDSSIGCLECLVQISLPS